MEQEIGILIADLSGYTSLTDTHGSFTAADLIDKFMQMVEESLIGSSEFHQRAGDEVLIVATSPDDLLSSAIALLQKSADEHEFLQLHGGLHYGKILKRNNHYFGNTINLAARIASEAKPGTFWCSNDFMQALGNPQSVSFHPKGEREFKNLRIKNLVFELGIDGHEMLIIDPVCKMQIKDRNKAHPHPTQPDVYFCSESCLNIYLGK